MADRVAEPVAAAGCHVAPPSAEVSTTYPFTPAATVAGGSQVTSAVVTRGATASAVGAVGRSVGDVRAALEARDRTRCGALAPPWGLYFVGVEYREDAT